MQFALEAACQPPPDFPGTAAQWITELIVRPPTGVVAAFEDIGDDTLQVYLRDALANPGIAEIARVICPDFEVIRQQEMASDSLAKAGIDPFFKIARIRRLGLRGRADQPAQTIEHFGLR